MSETDPGHSGDQHAGTVGAHRATVGTPTDPESINVSQTRPGAAENAHEAELAREGHETFIPEAPLEDDRTQAIESRAVEEETLRGGGPGRRDERRGDGRGDGHRGHKQPDVRDADEVRESIRETRQELGETVSALAHKVDVKSRASEAAASAKGRAADMAGTAKDRAAEMTSTARTKAAEVADTAKVKAHEVADTAKVKAQEMTDTAKVKAHEMTDTAKVKAQEMTGTAKVKAHEVADTAKVKAHEVADSARSRAHEVTGTAKVRAHEVADKVGEAPEQARKRPMLVVAAVGTVALLVVRGVMRRVRGRTVVVRQVTGRERGRLALGRIKRRGGGKLVVRPLTRRDQDA